MIDAAIFEILKADSTAASIFGQRFYMREAPESVTLPYCVRSEVNAERFHTLSGAGQLERCSRQITVIAATEADAIAGREAIRDALDGYLGSVTISGTTIKITSSISTNFGDIDDTGSEPRVYGKFVEFSFHWTVTA